RRHPGPERPLRAVHHRQGKERAHPEGRRPEVADARAMPRAARESAGEARALQEESRGQEEGGGQKEGGAEEKEEESGGEEEDLGDPCWSGAEKGPRPLNTVRIRV